MNIDRFFFSLMWLLFGWVPWLVYIVIYMNMIGVGSIPVNDPVNISLFVVGYLTFPIYTKIILFMIKSFLRFVDSYQP